MTQIVTANRLRDGLVVYLSADGGWSDRIGDAVEAADEVAARELMETANRSEIECRIVGPYLVKVENAADGPAPVEHREAVRVSGPTVQTSLNRGAHGGHQRRHV